MNKKTRVVVGMSGGVDSSVAAALLLRAGYDVIGITLKMWPQDCASLIEDKCCGPQAIEDARAVAARLGIPHYVIDETAGFQREVIDYFTAEYRSGRTPNPCVMCNQKLKFGNLVTRARGLDATHVATGHYARIEAAENGFVLRRAKDPRKDQSYFLFSLTQDQLASVLMPIGNLTKEETRARAREIGLRVHDKDESQDICFVPEDDYAAFLKDRLGPDGLQAGEIVHRDGRILGKHQGIELYTIGQRKGINVGHPRPLYVLNIDPVRRRVIVGDDDALWRDEFEVERVCWGAQGTPTAEIHALVRIRHNHAAAAAALSPDGQGRVRIRFNEPQRAITPGQAAVFYDGDDVLGGGWIARVHESRTPESATKSATA